MAVRAARRRPENVEKSTRPETGTILAKNSIPKSVTAFSVEAASDSWGGARNWAGRVSDEVALKQAEHVLAAVAFAICIGRPLNRHLTLHWGLFGFSEADAGKLTSAFLKLASQFLRSNGAPFAFVYVRENDEGDGSKGPHSHLLLHVPPEIAPRFVAMQRRWLRIVTGKAYRRKAMRTSRIGHTLNAATASPAVYAVNLAAVTHYVLKASCRAAVRALGLTHRPEYGRVIGKRAGWSENIGAAAREKWNV